jgi:hypothetical protein
LRHRLLESLWYLHAQPPLFNLLVGVVLKWSPFPDGLSFQIVYLAAGLALTLGVYDLSRQLKLGPVMSLGVTALVACGPPVVLWENVLNYDYLVAVCLVLLSDASARWARRGGVPALAALSALAAVAVLTRTLIHPILFVGIVAIALLVRRPVRWTWLPVAAIGIPALLIGGAILKNEVLFGTTQLSTWTGSSLDRVVVQPMPDRVKSQLVARRIIHPPGYRPPCRVSRPSVQVLADPIKPGIQPPNSNENWDCNRPYQKMLEHDAIAAARAEPGWTLRGIAGAAEIWATPSTFYWEVLPNAQRISGLNDAYRRSVLLDVRWHPPLDARVHILAAHALLPDGHYHIAITIVIATMLVVAAGFVATVGWFRRKRTPARAGLIAGAYTVTFVTVMSVVFEHGENNRLRFPGEPLTLILGVAIVVALVRRRYARASAALPNQTPGPSAPVS